MSSEPVRRPRPPSVEGLLAVVRRRLAGRRNGDALTAAARDLVADERQRLADGAEASSLDNLADRLVERLDAWASGGAGPGDLAAINATGVIVHTNLGRAPWPEAAIRAAEAAGREYLLLEIDRASGRRGARFRLAEEHLIALTGADDALVTNNNAAALALAVALAGRGRGVAVSRGELVEIGGGVRIPDIVRRAGAKLIEVGTTNRTRAADFEAPLAAGLAAIVLRVHPSNFRQEGFVEGPDAAALAKLAHRHGAIVVDDLGSGALLPTERFGLAHEPTPRERLAAGADVVTFSGDKLVGGPQAGLVVGRADLIVRMRRDPLARAMRPDKVTLAAVAATLGLYRAGLAESTIPVWQAIGRPAAELRARAMAIASGLGAAASVVDVRSTVGGGSLPGETLPSVAVAIRVGSADRLLAALRRGTPAVIGRIEDDQAVFDVRTVDPRRDEALAAALGSALRPATGKGR
jgi:L-seryl-tRNA(Ser) seleniumtransferase